MKRPREENVSMYSQVKQSNSTRAHPSAQPNMTPSTPASKTQNLTTNDALIYLKAVKAIFQDKREKYDEFLEVMKGFKSQSLDTSGVIERVKELFKGHRDLILGFNHFLPKGYEIKLPEEKKPIQFVEAISFVNKIKNRFHNDEHIYKTFLDILNMYRRDSKSIREVYSEVAVLFKNHHDLLEEFTNFLPNMSDRIAPQDPSFDKTFVRSQPMRHRYMEKEIVCSSHQEGDISVDRPDLENERQKRCNEKEKDKKIRDIREQDRDVKDIELESSALDIAHGRKPSSRVDDATIKMHQEGEVDENLGIHNVSSMFEDKNSLKSTYTQEFNFCEKVKEKLHSDAYQEFLKCLDIYSREIITRAELKDLVNDILRKYPDLMAGFNKFMAHCENIDGFLAGVINKKPLWNGHMARSLKQEERNKVAERERDCKDRDREKERDKEKCNLYKPISELDLTNCPQCTPSYRLLPDNYPMPSASHRTVLGASVLNDVWVSVTSGSEDYSFKHMRKNQYEESLFRCEDDRFELDMLLASVNATTKRVEELMEKMQDNTIKPETPFPFEDHFTSLNLRCIERLYGDHGLDVMDVLRKNASLALPVLLTRLKQKQEEWSRCRGDFSKVWAEIYAKNYHKSLDHRSFYFKQQETKSLSAKVLLAEIKEICEEDDDALFSVASGNKRPMVSTIEYEYTDREIHNDLYHIIKYACQEVCTSSDQLDKVMRIWTTFLEPLFDVPPRHQITEDIEGVSKAKSHVRSSVASVGECNGSPGASGVIVNTKSTSSDGDIPPEQENLGRARVANGNAVVLENVFCDSNRPFWRNDNPSGTPVHGRVQCSTPIVNEMSIPTMHTGPGKPLIDNVAAAAKIRSNMDVMSGITAMPKSCYPGTKATAEPVCNKVLPLSERGDTGPVLSLNGTCSNKCSEANLYHEDVGSPNEREEGELSPNGDFKEDNFVGFEDASMDPPAKQKDASASRPFHVRDGKVEACGDTAGENDTANANDACEESAQKSTEDSENTSDAAEDVSGSESDDGDVHLHEDHDVEEDGDHDDLAKAESEGEAEGIADANDFEGEITSLPFLECFHTVKPLAKHVPATLEKTDDKCSRIFYGNESFYVLFRHHQTFYERILSAKINSASAEKKWRSSKDANLTDLYAKFINALYSLLNGTADNTKFEDDCRAIIGAQSYVLFTLDKLIYKVIKQLQAIASDDMDNKLLQLYLYEKSRGRGRFLDTVYHENARVVLRGESIYRFECSSYSPARLSVQLMDYGLEKPEVTAVSIEPIFSSYLLNDFLSSISDRQERLGIFMRRNKRKFGGGDEDSICSKSLDGLRTFNGLECRIASLTSKVSYVLDTEDNLFRMAKRKRTSQGGLTSAPNQAHNLKSIFAKVQKFHHFQAMNLT